MSTKTSIPDLYVVTSSIVNLEQRIGSISHYHGKEVPRTVTWLKDDQDEEHLTLSEAQRLKDYLDSKPLAFEANEVKIVQLDDKELSVAEGALFTKAIQDGRVSTSHSIEISQCPVLEDYSLPFRVEGYLNHNDLT